MSEASVWLRPDDRTFARLYLSVKSLLHFTATGKSCIKHVRAIPMHPSVVAPKTWKQERWGS